MAPETEQTLNYDFNYNMVLCKALLSNLGLPQERQLATDWLQKLSNDCWTNIVELQQRNVYAYLLLLCLQDGLLKPPFDAEPPAAPLTSLEHLMPKEGYEDRGGDADEDHEYAGEDGSYDRHASSGHGHSAAYEFSPDGGEFFASQPVPRCGAFCYLAVVARQNQ